MHLLRSSAIAVVLAATVPMIVAPEIAQAQVSFDISVGFAPPPLPIYDQPPIPGPDYIWTPGYWAWDPDVYDYYWVPGTWTEAPQPGLLWTPPWWGFENGAYGFHEGYWGPQVGYYGGVDYGFGYDGDAYQGGYWRNNHFFYNSSVNNVRNAHLAYVYQKPVVINRRATASFNGPGGVTARPTAAQLAAARAPHIAPTTLQTHNVKAAAATPTLRASANHGAPPVAATAKPGAFSGPGVVKTAHAGGAYKPPPAAIQRQLQAKAAHGGPAAPTTASVGPKPASPGPKPASAAVAAHGAAVTTHGPTSDSRPYDARAGVGRRIGRRASRRRLDSGSRAQGANHPHTRGTAEGSDRGCPHDRRTAKGGDGDDPHVRRAGTCGAARRADAVARASADGHTCRRRAEAATGREAAAAPQAGSQAGSRA